MSTPPSSSPLPQSATSPAARPVRRAEIVAWAMYDWANSAYSTIQITVLMMYLQGVILPGSAGQLAYGYVIGISTLFAAVLSPILGAVVDARASKRNWLGILTFAGAAASVAMYFLPVAQAAMFVVLFFITSLAYELAWGVYNGFLPEIADEKTMNRISAYGFATGYIGGGLALLISILLVMFGGEVGLPSDLAGDCVVGHDIRFEVELPPAEYKVQVTVGDLTEAHGPMLLSIGGAQAENLRTGAGETETRSYTLRHAGDRLCVELAGPGLDGSAALAGIEISGAALDRPLVFDFGTKDSMLQKGAIAVTRDDAFKHYDRAALAEKSKQRIPATELPADLSFGFDPPFKDLTSHDAVLAPRLRLGLLIMGLWWAVFSLPAIIILRDRVQPRAGSETLAATARRSVREVARTLASVRRYRHLFVFLIAFLIYNDGVATIISQAGAFAKEVLQISAGDLVLVVLMIQFVSMPGALFMGWLSGKLGEKQTLLLCIAIYIGWLIAAFFINTLTQFWVMGGVLALVMGGIQSVSRSIMGLMTPASRSGEFFGFFNLSSKATSFAGPILFSSILALKMPHLAILSLLIFFIIGGGVALFVDVKQGHNEAVADVAN